MITKKLSLLLSAALLILCASACSSTTSTESADVSGGIVNSAAAGETAIGPTGTVRIIHVNDVHSYVEETDTAVGYPKIAAYIEQMRREDPNIIVLDAGDTFAGAASSAFDNGESLPAILNSIGFDAMTAGNADYSYGKEVIERFKSALDYPILCGNMPLSDGTQLTQGSMTLTLDNGLRVGIVSVTTPESMRMVGDTFVYENPMEACRKLVDSIRDEVDVVVALVHLGDTEGSEYTSDMIAESVSGIDVIVDGHSHSVLEQGKMSSNVLIAQAGEYSKYVGVIDLSVENGIVTQSKAVLLGKDDFADVADKEETAEALGRLTEKREDYFAEIIAQTSVDLIGTRDMIRTQETNIGNFYADAVRQAAQSDISILPAGVIGGEIPKGDISKGDILNIARIETEIILKEMRGADIMVLLNEKVKMYPESSPSFPQVSGLAFTFDPANQSDRVTEILIAGEPLDAERLYTVALAVGMSEDAGAVNGRFIETVGTANLILEEYIVQNSPIAPKIEGRITIIGDQA